MDATTVFWRYLPLNKPKNLTHEQIHNSIAFACNEWNKCLNDLIILKEGSGDLQLHVAVDSKINKAKKPTAIGECRDYKRPKRWEISIDIREKWNVGGWRKILGIGFDLRSTMLHEIGHVFDLPHSDDSSFIMYSEYNEQIKLSKKERTYYRDFVVKNSNAI